MRHLKYRKNLKRKGAGRAKAQNDPLTQQQKLREKLHTVKAITKRVRKHGKTAAYRNKTHAKQWGAEILCSRKRKQGFFPASKLFLQKNKEQLVQI